MRTKSNNIEIMMGSEADDIVKELTGSLLQKITRRNERINKRKRIQI